MRRLIAVVVLSFLVLGGYAYTPAQTDKDAAREARREQIRQCRAFLREAVDFIEAGAYDSALASLSEAVKCDPQNPDVFFHTARADLRLGDTTGAVAALEEGVAQAPLSRRNKLLLARLLIARAEHDRADSLIGAVLAIKPREGEAHYLRGAIALARGDTTAAVASWEEAVRLGMEPE